MLLSDAEVVTFPPGVTEKLEEGLFGEFSSEVTASDRLFGAKRSSHPK